MENYKKVMSRRIKLLSGLVLVTVAIGVIGFLKTETLDNKNMTDGIVWGFQFGLLCAMGLLSVVLIIKLRTVLKDDKKLKILYNKEHDERLKAIRNKAGMPMLMVTSLFMLIAAIIAGYFNITVFYTLVITAMVQLLVGALVKIYYMQNM